MTYIWAVFSRSSSGASGAWVDLPCALWDGRRGLDARRIMYSIKCHVNTIDAVGVR